MDVGARYVGKRTRCIGKIGVANDGRGVSVADAIGALGPAAYTAPSAHGSTRKIALGHGRVFALKKNLDDSGRACV